MVELPENPDVGDTVLEEFEHIDNDNDAFVAGLRAWVEGGKAGLQPSPDDYPVSFGTKTRVYFWNGLGWLQWVHNEEAAPVNVYIPE
jgi:hypothetical protein